MKEYWFLCMAIAAEMIGTTALKMSNGMSKLGPSLAIGGFFMFSFWMMSLSLKTLPIGYVYAIWSGVGILGAKMIGVICFQEDSHWAEILGIILLITGVLLISLFAPRKECVT